MLLFLMTLDLARFADKLRAEGKKVIGGSSYTDKLEIEREFGQQEASKGWSLGPSQLELFKF